MPRLKCFVCEGRFARMSRHRPASIAHNLYRVAGVWLCGLRRYLVEHPDAPEERFLRRKASPPRSPSRDEEPAPA